MRMWEELTKLSADIEEAIKRLDEEIMKISEEDKARLWKEALALWGDEPIHRCIMADPVVGLEWKKKLFREQYCQEKGIIVPGSREWLKKEKT